MLPAEDDKYGVGSMAEAMEWVSVVTLRCRRNDCPTPWRHLDRQPAWDQMSICYPGGHPRLCWGNVLSIEHGEG